MLSVMAASNITSERCVVDCGLLLLLFTAIDFSLGGGSPYTSDK